MSKIPLPYEFKYFNFKNLTLFSGMTQLSDSHLTHKNNCVSRFRALKNFFEPRSVAIIGATERPSSVGLTVIRNLLDALKVSNRFTLYPINPNREWCCGLRCYESITACPVAVDLAIIVTPPLTVLPVLERCCEAKVGGVVIITAGFKETGQEGYLRECKMLDLVKQYGIRIIGPNCLGIMSLWWGLNASFAASIAHPGGIAFVSQSGAMCTAILDWSLEKKIGFSAFVSVGSMVDVDWGDFIDYFNEDPHTHTIMLYMETVGRPREFLAAARRTKKPLVVIKSGQSECAAKAAISHTGSLAGSHAAFLTAVKRAGVCVVDTIADLLNTALFLGKQPHPMGRKLLIITNAGGPGVLSTDAGSLAGADIAELAPDAIEKLNAFLPGPWSHGNPVDILGDASKELYDKTLEVLLPYETYDGILIILSPQSVTDAVGTARCVIEAYRNIKAKGFNRPLLCSWMGGLGVKQGVDLLNDADIPSFSCPDDASRLFAVLSVNRENKISCRQFEKPIERPQFTYDNVKNIIQTVRAQDRILLTEEESKKVLSCYGIPVCDTVVCGNAKDAQQNAKLLGKWPLVAKVHSRSITHKSDVGGVILNLNTEESVHDAFLTIQKNVSKAVGEEHFEGITIQPMYNISNGYEFILGSTFDSQMGLLLLVGSGGTMVEVYKDTVLDLPPIGLERAQQLLFSTSIGKALKEAHGNRFKPINCQKLASIISLFSSLIADMGTDIAQIDINPLFGHSDTIVALDCRVVLHSKEVQYSLEHVQPISSYPFSYCCKKPHSYFEVARWDYFQNISQEYLPKLCHQFTDSLGFPFHMQRFLECLQLNDFTHYLGFVLYDTRTSLSRPISLFVMERICGTRDAARVCIFNLSVDPHPPLLKEALDYVIAIAQIEKIIHLLVLAAPATTFLPTDATGFLSTYTPKYERRQISDDPFSFLLLL